MNVFVDTSVWSLAFRRDRPQEAPQVDELARALAAGEAITTGIVLQDLLQGFGGPKSHRRIIDHFVAVPLLHRIGKTTSARRACVMHANAQACRWAR